MGWPKGRSNPKSPELLAKIARRRTKSPTERLLRRRVVQPNGCWEWQGAKDDSGYGLIRVGAELIRTHIIAWRLWVGSHDEFYVLHTCDNPSCFNPEHLFLGTAADNAADRDAKGRWKDHWKLS